MERLSVTGQDQLMLQGFKIVLEETYRRDLEPNHREHVYETLNEIAKNCVDKGFGLELAKIRDDVAVEQKLIRLKKAYDNGEIAI